MCENFVWQKINKKMNNSKFLKCSGKIGVSKIENLKSKKT